MAPSESSFFPEEQANPNDDFVMDIAPQAVFKKLQQAYLIDVRSAEEFTGELGHVPGAHLIVLDHLPEKASTLPKDRPLVVICRSGARSARACAFLKSSGFEQVWNLEGGMLRWNECKLPTEKSL